MKSKMTDYFGDEVTIRTDRDGKICSIEGSLGTIEFDRDHLEEFIYELSKIELEW